MFKSRVATTVTSSAAKKTMLSSILSSGSSVAADPVAPKPSRVQNLLRPPHKQPSADDRIHPKVFDISHTAALTSNVEHLQCRPPLKTDTVNLPNDSVVAPFHKPSSSSATDCCEKVGGDRKIHDGVRRLRPVVEKLRIPLPASIANCQLLSTNHKRLAVGLLVTLVGAGSIVVLTASADVAVSSDVISGRNGRSVVSLLVIYIVTLFQIIVYPMHVVFRFLRSKERSSMSECLRESCQLFAGPDGICTSLSYRVALVKCIILSLIWTLTGYIYLCGLQLMNGVDSVALLATHSNFVYITSWIILHHDFVALRIVSLIVALTGIILIIYSDTWFRSDGMVGAVIIVIATVFSSLYRVLFKLVFGETTADQMSFSISCIGLLHITTLWLPIVILYFAGCEAVAWTRFPYLNLVLIAFFAVVLQCLMITDSALVYTQFVQTSYVVAIPFYFAFEWAIYGHIVSNIHCMQFAGYVLIALATFVNTLPEHHSDAIFCLQTGLKCHKYPLDEQVFTDSAPVAMTPSSHSHWVVRTPAATPRSTTAAAPAVTSSMTCSRLHNAVSCRIDQHGTTTTSSRER